MKIRQATLDRANRIDATATEQFVAEAKKRGYTVRKSSKNQDMFQHIDYIITKDGVETTVDVKGLKRYVDQGAYLVELQNVQGKRGWLFGKAQMIAFLTPQGFKMIPRSDIFRALKAQMGMKVRTGMNFIVETPNGKRSTVLPVMSPNWYRRDDRPKEKTTYIAEKDIDGFAVKW